MSLYVRLAQAGLGTFSPEQDEQKGDTMFITVCLWCPEDAKKYQAFLTEEWKPIDLHILGMIKGRINGTVTTGGCCDDCWDRQQKRLVHEANLRQAKKRGSGI